MLLLLGILLDGLVTLILGVVIGMESKASPLFNVCLALLHGVMAGFLILLLMAVRALERDATSEEAITAGRPRREPKVVPISARPRLDQAA